MSPAKVRQGSVCYTRADDRTCEEIVSCGRDGAYLSSVLCADAEDERAERHADKSALLV